MNGMTLQSMQLLSHYHFEIRITNESLEKYRNKDEYACEDTVMYHKRPTMQDKSQAFHWMT